MRYILHDVTSKTMPSTLASGWAQSGVRWLLEGVVLYVAISGVQHNGSGVANARTPAVYSPGAAEDDVGGEGVYETHVTAWGKA
ncbi:hypothetical protein VMCG_10531 [Cytospora schulzeri]|uniref:Uncharacterized protein n=1 Tax=Cytospora schulzeri TaxID=448051 RepID=A0A423VBZ0_9PEZI|nr:hypothetical protein VMCG_10531 [Valsa malicola]